MRPSCERRRLCYAPFRTLALGTSALACRHVHRRTPERTLVVAAAWTDGAPSVSPASGARPRTVSSMAGDARERALLGRRVVGRLRRLRRLGRRTALEPLGLRIHLGEAHPATGAPGARDRAGRAAEVRDHLAGASAGHTLPRPVGPLRLIFAVVCLACHEAMRLAFHG
jgi:hypothetical protein